MFKNLILVCFLFMMIVEPLKASSSENEEGALKRSQRSFSFSDEEEKAEKSKKVKQVSFNEIRQVVYFSNKKVNVSGSGFDYAYGSQDRSRTLEYIHQEDKLKVDPAYANIRKKKLLQAQERQKIRQKFEQERDDDISACESFENYCYALGGLFYEIVKNIEGHLDVLTKEEITEFNESFVSAANAFLSYEGENSGVLRAQYVEMLKMRTSLLMKLIKSNPSIFHRSYSLLSDSIQSLIHEEEFEFTKNMLQEAKAMFDEKSVAAHKVFILFDDCEICDGRKCEEYRRDLEEKIKTILWVHEAKEQGRDYREFITEKLLEKIKGE